MVLMLLWWAEPVACYKSISFRVKLALVGINTLVRKRITLKSREARFGAYVSLLFWVALVLAGRGIAFL
jgi:hypothetical protein